MKVRPAALYAHAHAFSTLGALLRDSERDGFVFMVEPADNPWGCAHHGLALVCNGQSVLMPVIGEWPLGPGASTDALDLPHVEPASLVAALRALMRDVRNPGDLDSSFKTARGSNARIASVATAILQSNQAETHSLCREDDGMLLLEIGLDDDGRPQVWIETAQQKDNDLLLVELPDHVADRLAREEPLCLMGGHREDVELDGIGSPTLILSTSVNAEHGDVVEAFEHDSLNLMRVLAEWTDRR